jgi:hypothetical protein
VFAYHVQDPERYGVVEFDAVSAGLKLHDFSRSDHAGLLRPYSSIASSFDDLLQAGRLDCSGSVVD